MAVGTIDIKIVEKPEWVTWDEVQSVIAASHEENHKKGIVMLNSMLSAEAIKEKVGENGKVFVALDGKKVVGVAAIKQKCSSLWFGTNTFGYCCFASILPEYNGRGLYGILCEKREEIAKELGLDMMMFDTHERNQNVITMNERKGYYKVGCKVCKNHDNVVMVKWLNGCPYSHTQVVSHYWKSRITVKLKKTLAHIVKGTK